MLKVWLSRRLDANTKRNALQVDEWPPLLGKKLSEVVSAIEGKLLHGPAVVIITGSNNVGAIRIASFIDRSGAFVTWLIHAAAEEPIRVPVAGVRVILKDPLRLHLPLPHAVFLGRDGRIWRRASVAVGDAWMRFVDEAQAAFKSGL